MSNASNILVFIALLLIAHSLRSMSRRLDVLEDWLKRHKGLYNSKERDG
jgi:hypothetical protein